MKTLFRNHAIYFFWIFIFLFLSTKGITQPGTNDNTFNSTDLGNGVGDGFNGSIRDVAELPDGSLIIGGTFSGYQGLSVSNCARILLDGTVDYSFLSGQGANAIVNKVQVQTDGKCLIGGYFTSVQGVSRTGIARIANNGSLDLTFNTTLNVSAYISAIEVLSDGKILIGGSFTTVNGTSRSRIARLNADGTLDASFNPGLGANDVVHMIRNMPNGKILVGGAFTTFNGLSANRLIMLNADGTIDASFNIGSGAGFTVFASALQADGKILVAGQFNVFNGLNTGHIVRLEANGSLDVAFHTAAFPNGTISDVIVQSDNKVVICGYFTLCCNGLTRNRMVRVNENGTIDNTFSNLGFNSGVSAMTKLSNGDWIAVGDFTALGIVGCRFIAKLNANGYYAPFMTLANGANEAAFEILNLPDNKKFISGQFSAVNGIYTGRLVKISANGAVDETFPYLNFNIYNGAIQDMIQTSNGNIIAVGGYSFYSGSFFGSNVISITPNGAVNWVIPSSSWTTYYGGINTVTSVRELPSGGIVIGGTFTSLSGVAAKALAKLGANGAIDVVFNSNMGTGFNGAVNDIQVFSDGRILVVGSFTSFNGVGRNGVCVLNANGTLNTSFNPGSGANGSIGSCAIQSDGKILLTGEFTSFNGVSRNYINRLNANGSNDTGFNIGTGPNNFVYKAELQSNGKIIAIGTFTLINGNVARYIARFNSDGSLDASFNSGNATLNSPIIDMSIQSDGHIMIAGFFKTYNGAGRNRIARVLGGECGSEVCNGIDDDCNGVIDNGFILVNYYNDSDGDGYGSGTAINACQSPGASYVTNNTDCNDNNAALNNYSVETCNYYDDDCDGTIDNGLTFVNYYNDNDGDGYGSGSATNACQSPGATYVTNNTDCNDNNASLNSISAETCNGFDDDCNGTVDNGLTFVDYYNDSDGDGYGSGTAINACQSPGATYVTNNTDCNDSNASLNSISVETCNGFDDDCDGTIDNGLVFVNYYNDNDGDGYGSGTATNACQSPGATYVTNNTDCNDNDFSIYPAAIEICNDIDEDCDGVMNNGLWIAAYIDNDGDGFGDPTISVDGLCQLTTGYVGNNDDCDDTNPSVYVNATEICDGLDNNCNGSSDEGLTFVNYYNDNDGDGYGSGTATNACQSPGSGYVTNNTDCLPTNAGAYPGALEICGNTIDEDCNGFDLGCSGAGPDNATTVLNIGQYGTGPQSNSSVNFGTATSSPQSPGSGLDKWYQFTAATNAVRIAYSGSTSVADDNRLMLFNSGQNINVTWVPIFTEDNVHPGSQGVASDGGNEIALYDNLTPGNTYYLCVQNTNSTPGNGSVIVSWLYGSQADIGPYTSNTNIYSNVCQNFKAKFRPNGKYYTVHRWTDGTASGTPEWTYTIPTLGSTICQLGKIVSPNLTTTLQQKYVTVDVEYQLPNGFGTVVNVNAHGSVVSNFGLNPEGELVVRSADVCPVYKSTTSSVSTNRSVCGVSYYNWKFTLAYPTSGLPVMVNGPLGGSRVVALSQVSGMANGQRYDVQVKPMHADDLNQAGYSSVSCVRTIGAAGMVTAEEEAVMTQVGGQGHWTIYPNPSREENGNVVLQITGWERDEVADIVIHNAMGQEVLKTQKRVQNGRVSLDWKCPSAGVYYVTMGGQTVRWVVM